MVDNPLTVFYSVFMAVWTVLFIEFWKRKTSVLQFEWDTIDYEKRNETIRPQFETRVATRRKNPVTGVSVDLLCRITILLTRIYNIAFLVLARRALCDGQKACAQLRHYVFHCYSYGNVLLQFELLSIYRGILSHNFA